MSLKTLSIVFLASDKTPSPFSSLIMTYHDVIHATFQCALYVYLGDGFTGITSSGQGNETSTVVSGHLLGDSSRGGECSTLYEEKHIVETQLKSNFLISLHVYHFDEFGNLY